MFLKLWFLLQIISLFPLYSLASESLLVLNILSSGETELIFIFFSRMQWKLGKESKESGVFPALAVLYQQITSHQDWLWMGLIFLWLQRHRGSLKVVSIFLCFPHSCQGMGCAEGPWHRATSTASLSQLKIHSALPQLALGTPWAPSCYLLSSDGMTCFPLSSRTHTPGELSCLAAVLSQAPHKVSSSTISAGHSVCIWEGRCSAVRSPWLIVSHLMSIPAQQYSQCSA